MRSTLSALFLSLLLGASLIALVTGCDSASGGDDTGGDVHGADVVTADTPGGAEDDAAVSGESCDELVAGTTYLFDTLTIDAPGEPAVQQVLEDTWQADIDNGRMFILYRVESVDAAAGTAVFAIGNAVETEQGYAFSPAPELHGVTLTATADGCAFASQAKGSFTIAPATLNRPVQFEDFETSGVVAPDGAAIVEGRLSGGLTVENVDGLIFDVPLLGETELQPLFDAFGIEADLDLDEDGTYDAYWLDGGFTAAATDVPVEG